MRARTGLAVLAGLAAVVATAVSTAAARAEDPKRRPTRLVEVTCHATLPERPKSAPVELWLARPLGETARDFQTVEEPLTHVLAGTKAFDRTPALFHATAAPDSSFSLTWIARVERREQKTPPEVLASAASELSADEKKSLAHDLEPEADNAFDEDFLKLARSLAPGEKAFAKIARAAYDHVLASMRYEKPAGKGWGHGSIQWACREGYGNCTDFHALFMNLCRARGIPARFCMGVSLGPDHRGVAVGYHCWAEFYLPGGHWVPVDASEAWKHLDQREYFFGNVDSDRVLLARGRDVVLQPAQKGSAISLFKLAYAETGDGKEVPVTVEASWEDLSSR